MKKLIVVVALYTICHAAWSQQDSLSITRALDGQVWIPFLKGVMHNDARLYNGINSPDFFWVMDGNRRLIMDHAAHVKDAAKVMQQRKDQGIKTRMEVRFTERNVTAEFASEQLIIATILVYANGDTKTDYSRAHVFSRLESGKWKRWINYYEGASTPDAFAAATAIHGWNASEN